MSRANSIINQMQKAAKTHALQKEMKISDRQLAACYGLSKITVKDMKRDYGRTQHMVFVEFLEYVCRVAHTVEFIDVKDPKRHTYNRKPKVETTDHYEEELKIPDFSAGSDKDDAIEERRA